MLIKMDLRNVSLSEDGLTIRRITENDRDTFSRYTSIDHFEEALNATDTLGIFIDEEMVGSFISYDHSENEKINEVKTEGTLLGYSCRKDHRNKGILSKALTMLSDHILQEKEQIYLEIEKNNTASRHVARNAGFREFNENEKKIYYIKRKTR